MTPWVRALSSAVLMRRVNGWFTIFWIAMIPVSVLTGWINSVTYVAILSLWALVSGHWSAWQAARTEVKQESGPTEVIDLMIEHTTIDSTDPTR